jgi:hypothetical protein
MRCLGPEALDRTFQRLSASDRLNKELCEILAEVVEQNPFYNINRVFTVMRKLM